MRRTKSALLLLVVALAGSWGLASAQPAADTPQQPATALLTLTTIPSGWSERVDLRPLLQIYADGRAKAIGVSNFLPEHLTRLIEETSVVPAVNQIELHPQLQQAELRAFHAQHGIKTEAWSPLGQGRGLLEVPTVVAIAQKHERTPAQVVLRWHLQTGNVVIPKSVTPSRIAENFDVFGFELDDEDMLAMAALDEGKRLGPDPDGFDWN